MRYYISNWHKRKLKINNDHLFCLKISKDTKLERKLMLTTTTDSLQGQTIEEYLGVVTAEVVYGSNALRDFFAGFRDFFGGRTGSYEKLFTKGQKEAVEELEKRAEKLGADAVIGIKVDTGTINIDEEGALLVITATGTAIKLG
jgi:uncharacterized protein YbjQ (UPF0145 family)